MLIQFKPIKLAALKELNTISTMTAAGMATSLGVSIPSAEMLMLRLLRQGLVTRSKEMTGEFKRPAYIYTLTRRGSTRLHYLESLK